MWGDRVNFTTPTTAMARPRLERAVFFSFFAFTSASPMAMPMCLLKVWSGSFSLFSPA